MKHEIYFKIIHEFNLICIKIIDGLMDLFTIHTLSNFHRSKLMEELMWQIACLSGEDVMKSW